MPLDLFFSLSNSTSKWSGIEEMMTSVDTLVEEFGDEDWSLFPLQEQIHKYEVSLLQLLFLLFTKWYHF